MNYTTQAAIRELLQIQLDGLNSGNAQLIRAANDLMTRIMNNDPWALTYQSVLTHRPEPE